MLVLRIHATTVDELLALNDEILAIARAGIPLEQGLKAISPDMTGSLRRLVEIISHRMERGESLATVLGDPALSLPPVYCAVVAAGVRCGRLPAALESLSRSVKRAAELRRLMVIAFVYPCVLILFATAIFIFTWQMLLPVLLQTISQVLESQLPDWLRWLQWTSDHGNWGLIALWLFFALFCGTWFIRSRRAANFGRGWRRWPSIGSVNAAVRVATFSEILALLLEHQVSMPEALHLAGTSCGERRISIAAATLAEQIRSGEIKHQVPTGMPPLLSWLILTNASPRQLVHALRQTAESQREYAARVSLILGIYLPIVLSAIVGGLLALYYAILVMSPFIYLLYELGQP